MAGFIKRLFGPKQPPAPTRDVAALVAPLAVPAVQVMLIDAPSRSHFGGEPNVPPGVAWPENRKGKPLDSLARLSLPEIHAAHRIPWLPTSGALLFFYDLEEQPWGFDPDDRGAWVVMHVPDLSEPVALAERELRPGASGPLARSIGFRRIDVLPSYERPSIEALQLTDAELDAFDELQRAAFGAGSIHQIVGFPQPVQGDDMELDCQLASNGVDRGGSSCDEQRAAQLAEGARDWRLLFQFDTDDELEVMWGDAGMIYYWVEEKRARNGDFTNVWLVLQCH